MSAGRRQPDLAAESAPRTGNLLDVKTRSVQQMNGSKNCLGTNLSEMGTSVLGVEKQDSLQLVVYENGIWIPRNDE